MDTTPFLVRPSGHRCYFAPGEEVEAEGIPETAPGLPNRLCKYGPRSETKTMFEKLQVACKKQIREIILGTNSLLLDQLKKLDFWRHLAFGRQPSHGPKKGMLTQQGTRQWGR